MECVCIGTGLNFNTHGKILEQVSFVGVAISLSKVDLDISYNHGGSKPYH